MKKKKRNSMPPRKMNPVFLIFHEGDTEEAYINFLKHIKPRLPVKLLPRKAILFAPEIKRRFEAEKIGPGDKITTFLMYDLDVKDNAKKLAICNKNIKESISLASNPAIELWFLLHNKEQNAAISTKNCIETLMKSEQAWDSYKKGSLSEKQKQQLWDNRKLASDRAKRLPEGENPSSSAFRLIDEIEEVNSQNIKELNEKISQNPLSIDNGQQIRETNRSK
jgi:hypothetical protein